MMESDDEFEDLLAGVEQSEGSSQDSLAKATANLDVSNYNGDEIEDSRSIPPVSINYRDADSAYSQHSVGPNKHLCSDATEIDSSPVTRNPSTVGCLAEKPSCTVIEKIEAVFEGITDALLNETDELVIELQTRITQPARTPASMVNYRRRRICFPGKSAEEAWRFTVVTRILELIHGALRDGIVLSKRDIYYRDPALFGKQTHVDRYVDDIALTFGVTRSRLNVTAVGKGLVAGAIKLCHRDGSIVDAANDRDGMLIPSLREILSVDMASVRCILVIEKEATFRSIAASSFWKTLSTRGVIITGKGYPDIATRALLRFLATSSPQNGFSSPQVFGLVDFDSDGLNIFSVYKYGSVALTHENPELRVPHMQWLGLRSEHMMLGGDDVHATQGLLSLTVRDRRKAVRMLEHPMSSDGNGDDADAKLALQVMLMFNTKAELQLLDSVPDGMASLLRTNLSDL